MDLAGFNIGAIISEFFTTPEGQKIKQEIIQLAIIEISKLLGVSKSLTENDK